MKLYGKKPRDRISLDDIFDAPDDFGLLNVKPRSPTPRQGDLMAARFEELNQYIDQIGRLPSEHGDGLPERQMAQRMKSILNLVNRDSLNSFDRHRILLSSITASEIETVTTPTPVAVAVEDVMSIDDILGGDDLGMLDLGDTSILDIKHVPISREASDEVAQRKRCGDFWQFESIFRNLHADIKSGKAESMPFVENWQISAGEAFILNGIMCFVDSVGDEHDRSDRVDARLRLIFENGTESNMLRRSLGKELHKDEHGRRVLRDRSDALNEAFQDIRLTHRDRRTGLIYIVKTKSEKPVLKQFPHLYKIGYTELTLDDRIRNAENDTAFLESPVQKVTQFECYNMNPQKFESLIHGFFAVQRLKVELTGKDGKLYQPREWFAVTLDVARDAISKIIDGSIVQYRMDNTTGRIVKKYNASI